MLVGAFASVWAAADTHAFWTAILVAILAGILFALMFAVVTVNFGADQILSGVAMNILAVGLTTYLARAVWGVGAAPIVDVGGRWQVPFLSNIPLLGPILFNQSILTYTSLGLVLVSSFLLWRTRWGLILRATGELAAAIDTSGFSVLRVRYLSIMGSGALAALGGAALALSQAQTFTNNMTGGRGFLALTAAVLGRWNPALAFAGSLLFGGVDALQLRLQIALAGGSSYLIQSIPALIAILAIVASGKASRYPANIGIPYRREER